MKDFKATKPNGEIYRGVYYREHPTRKHGLHPDRYYFLKYWARGRTQTEGIGWASEGVKPSDAHKRLIQVKAAIKAGTYETPAERKAREEAERRAMEEAEKQAKAEALTLGEVFTEKYLPYSKATKRHASSWRREEALHKLWVAPVIGGKPLKEVAPIHLEKIKTDMLKAGRAPRTARYALEFVRQVFNYAARNGLYEGPNPVNRVKLPSPDNRRMRYLTKDEAQDLLAELKGRSKTLHDMAALSLYAGLRFGEIASLEWADVDLEAGTLMLRDTKSGKTRVAFMNDTVKAILEARPKGNPTDLVFPARGGGKMAQASKAFNQAVDKLGLNDGIKDRRQRVCFHSLRHTFASHLVESGTDLFTVKELLGHADFGMAARYSHVGAETLRAAVRKLDKAAEEKNAGAEVVAIAE